MKKCPKNKILSGIGQGNSAAGPMWIYLEAPMIQVLQKYTNGVNLISVQGSRTFKNNIVGFIDDNNTSRNYDF